MAEIKITLEDLIVSFRHDKDLVKGLLDELFINKDKNRHVFAFIKKINDIYDDIKPIIQTGRKFDVSFTTRFIKFIIPLKQNYFPCPTRLEIYFNLETHEIMEYDAFGYIQISKKDFDTFMKSLLTAKRYYERRKAEGYAI